MIELLEECVRIRSLSGQEGAVASYLCNQMAALGMKAHVDAAGNAVGIIGDGPRQLVLLGHMDTVDGVVPVCYENGALYGRGTVDAKGPLCAFILAAGRLAACGQALNGWQIIVIGATEEEAATSKGARYAVTQYHPDMCIIGEPSGADGVTLGYKGRLVIKARFQQPSHHTATPGPSAAEQAVRLWNWLDGYAHDYNVERAKVYDQIMPSLRYIHSEDDGLREWCDITISLRLPEAKGPLDMQHAFEAWAATATNAPDMTFLGHEVAWRSSKDTPLARAFIDGIRAQGARPALKLKTGTADLNVVGPIWGCPIVAYGPGDSSLDHTPDEHVNIAEFERAVAVLEKVIRNIVTSQ